MSAPAAPHELGQKPGAWVDLGLTLPIFLLYHAGVVFLRVQNATDVVTGQILRLAEGNRSMYLLITASIGVVFAAVFAALGRGQAFRPQKFVQIALEGVVYAILMRIGAAYVVGQLFAGPVKVEQGPFVGFVMSLGAGFYEELAFRVILFGLGAKLLVWLFAHERYGVVTGQAGLPGGGRSLTWRAMLVMLLWSLAAAAIFSGIHYIGTLGDPFALNSFVFRMVLGVVLTAIFVLRGFAAAVWAHALYDVWVLVFPLV